MSDKAKLYNRPEKNIDLIGTWAWHVWIQKPLCEYKLITFSGGIIKVGAAYSSCKSLWIQFGSSSYHIIVALMKEHIDWVACIVFS